MNTEWTYPADMTLRDFQSAGLAVPGMFVEFQNRYADGTETALIGHMNDLLGLCDDCSEDRRARVVRYRRVWSPDDPDPSEAHSITLEPFEVDIEALTAYFEGATDEMVLRVRRNPNPKETDR